MAKRIGVTLEDDFYEKFCALGEFDNKRPATLATEILKEYMKSRDADIAKILQAKADYQKNVQKIRLAN